MKWLVMPLLGAIFVVLLAGSVQSISADHLEPGQGIYKDETKFNLVPTKDSNYQIYLQSVYRNGDDQLISVLESTGTGVYIPHKITDQAFDTLLGKKEIITIDNIKYEKVQFNTSSKYRELFDVYDREPTGVWEVEICGEPIKKYGYDCTNIFWSNTAVVYLEMNDVTTVYWTILREMN